jgi:hypothetical protein
MGTFEQDLRDYLAAEERADRESDFIQGKADELYLGEYSPEREDNFSEFLGNMSEPLLRELMAAINAHNGGKETAVEVVAILNDGAMEYWRASSLRRAKNLFADGYYD